MFVWLFFPAKVDELSEQMLAFELENQRLQQELLQSQEDNNERLRRMKNTRSQEEGMINRKSLSCAMKFFCYL